MLDILLVDDNADHLMLMSAILAHEGRVLWLAPSAARAIQLIHERAYALAVFDVRMPDVDGLALLAIMRQSARDTHTPVLLVSAAPIAPTSLARLQALAGEHRLLPKPIDPDVLGELAGRMLRRAA